MAINFTKWWTHHVRETVELVKGVENQNSAQVARAEAQLAMGVDTWRKIVGYAANNQRAGKIAADLMNKHIQLVRNLAEAGLMENDSAWESSLNQLIRNMHEQANFLNSVVYGFDKWKFVQLFREHLMFTGGYVKAAVNQNVKEFLFDVQRALNNASQFDKFTESVFRGGGI